MYLKLAARRPKASRAMSMASDGMTRIMPAGLVFLATTSEAFASGGGAEPGLFSGDVGVAVWTLLIFALVVLVLGKFAWGPILQALQKREDFIRGSLEKAKEDREAAEARLKEYDEKLKAASTEAKDVLDEARRNAEAARLAIEEEAKNEAKAMIDRAKREIDLATASAVKEICDVGGKLAVEVASRIVRKELNAKEHERLIAESIDELSKMSRN